MWNCGGLCAISPLKMSSQHTIGLSTTTFATGGQASTRTAETEWRRISSSASANRCSDWELTSEPECERTQESEPKGQPLKDRAIRAAEKEKERYHKPPADTPAILVSLAFDVYGMWREKAGAGLRQGARRRLEKRDAL